MEDFIDFKRIKEEIIETDSVIKKNELLKKNILQKKKQLKQLTNDFEILKLEYDYKLFQLDEKKKQCDNFKTGNVSLESENSSIKEEYNKILNDYQVLHIKYQTMCKDLVESQESLEKCKITESPIKAKSCLKKRKREILETFENDADSGSDFSVESDEEGKLLEKKLSEIPKHTEEDPGIQTQCILHQEVENTSDMNMKITYLTASNNILKDEVANCKEKIKTLNIILQSKEIEWSEKEKKLTNEVAELKNCLKYNEKHNNSIINKNQSIFDIGEEKVEMQKENLSDISNKKCDLQKPICSLVSIKSTKLECNLKSFPTNELLKSTLDKDIVSANIECDLPSFAENENSSDEESTTSDINDVLREMRKPYRLMSPIPELHKDSAYSKNSTATTSELSKLKSSTETVSIATGHESNIQNNSRNDRYNKQRQLKTKLFHKLITRKKAQNLYWRKKVEFIQKSTCNSKVKRSKINTPKNYVNVPMKQTEEANSLNKNASVDSIITVLADLVSKKLRYGRTRKKSIQLNHCDDSKNVLEVNKMLLMKARQSMTDSSDCEKHQNSSSLERSSSESDTPIFDSCYESLNSNPPSIENTINDNKSKIDWQSQNKISLERGNTGESCSDNVILNVQESNECGKTEKGRSVIIQEFAKERYSISLHNSGNIQMEHKLGNIHELISTNVEKKESERNKILEKHLIFESSMDYSTDHCYNIQKDGLNEMQKPGSCKEIAEKMCGDVKPNKHIIPLEYVHPNINNLKTSDNLVLSIEHSQIQSGKYNLSVSNSESQIDKNTKSAANNNVKNVLSNTNELLEKYLTSPGNDKVESETCNSNEIKENSTFESNVNCLKGCSYDIQYDASNLIQKSRSFDIDENLIVNIIEKSQIQSGECNLNSSNSELEVNKITISIENDNVKSEINNTNKILEKNSTFEINVNCKEVCSFNNEDNQKFSCHLEEIAEKINEDMEPKKQTEAVDHVHPIINHLEISDNSILDIEGSSQIKNRKCDLKLNNPQLNINTNIKSSEYLKKETEVSNTNEIFKENMFESILNCVEVHDFDIRNDELIEDKKSQSQFEEITEKINENMEHKNLDHVHTIVKDLENLSNKHLKDITEKINEGIEPQRQTEALHSVHPVNNLEISNNLIPSIEENSQIQTTIFDLKRNNSELETNKNMELTQNGSTETEISNTNEILREDTIFESNLHCLKVPNFSIQNEKLIETQCRSHFEEITEKINENMKFENLDHMHIIVKDLEISNTKHLEDNTEKIDEDIKPQKQKENLDHVDTFINNLEISENFILGSKKNMGVQTGKCDLKLINSLLETDKSKKYTENFSRETETMFESNLNRLKVHDFNIQDDELIATEKCQRQFEEIIERINEDVKPGNLDHSHAIVKDLEICDNDSLSSSEFEINENIKASENDIKLIEMKNNKISVFPESLNINEDCKSKMISEKRDESIKNENIDILYNKMYHYEEEECDRLKNNVKGGYNHRNIDIHNQNQCKDQKLGKGDNDTIEYSKERNCSHSENVLQKTEEFHNYSKNVNNHCNLACITNSGKIVDDPCQMKTDPELVGKTVSAMTEFQSDDINNSYKIFHYDDTISSESFKNYSDSNSTTASESNSWEEPTNRSNESMWYDFGHNSLFDIRKSKSYHESRVHYEQNVCHNDFETSECNKLTSNKRSNEEEFVRVSKIPKSEYVSSFLDSEHASPMEHKTKSIQCKMKQYPSKSKNTVNLTHESTDCKTKMNTNEHMNMINEDNNSVEEKIINDDVVKSCELNFITDMEIDFNISQHLLAENYPNEYPSNCIPSIINDLSGDPDGIHNKNYLEKDDNISVNHLVKKNQTQLTECSENLLKNVNSNGNKLISENCFNSKELSEPAFSNKCNSNCIKLEDVQVEQCFNNKKTPCKRKASRLFKTISKVVVSNYNLRKFSKFKQETNVFVPSAGDTLNNISLNTSDISNICVKENETSDTDLKYRKMNSVLTSNEETDLFGSLSESSDNESLSSRNSNKTSKIIPHKFNLGECQKLGEKLPCPLPPETRKYVLPNYSNNANCQNDENTSSNILQRNFIKTENLQEFSNETDLFGSLSELPENESSVFSNCTGMLKTLAPNHLFQKTPKQEEVINPVPLAQEMLKNVSFNSSHESGLQDLNRETDLFGSLSETSNDDSCSNEFDTNCKPTTPKRRRKSYQCNTQQSKKKVAKKGLLMRKSIRTYKDKNLAFNSAEKQIILHNESIIKTNARSNIEGRLENFSKNVNISKSPSHYKNIETSSDFQSKKSKNSENDSTQLQSTIFKRSKNSSGTYSISSVKATSGLKNITKKIKEESLTSSSMPCNEIHDVNDEQNIEISNSSDNFQKKNDSLNLRGTATAICEDSAQNEYTSTIKIRQSRINPANENEHKSSKKNLELESRYNFVNNDSKIENKGNYNPSEVPKKKFHEREEKINILQEVVIRPSKVNAKKFEMHTPAHMRISGFKRPNNSKIIPPCPLSPTPPTSEEIVLPVEPIIIPLEKPAKMETSKAAALFRKLITYSKEEKTVEEISRQFTNQDADHISRLILEQITQDTEKANKDDTSAPLMTDTQRVMLGFMLKLEKMKVKNLIMTYLKISEARLLQANTLQEIDSITRLYVAICKSHKYIGRIRLMCCDAFYFMGDFAIPFFFIILVSWIQVLPMEEEMENFPIVKVLIQLVNMKSCNFPGYNLLPLRDLLNKYYKYPIEPWNIDNFFVELFNNYLKNPVRPNDFSILLYCKNNSSKWVNEKINNLIKPTLDVIKKENLKATVIILISNIISQFNGKLDGEYVDSARRWLKCLIEGEDVTEVIKESIIISLRKLPKTPKNLKVTKL